MKRITVYENSGIQLDEISVAAGSVFDCVLVGIDPLFGTVKVALETTGAATAPRISAVASPGGEWRLHITADNLTTAHVGKYHVIAENGTNTYVLGSGTLRVTSAIPPEQ